MTKTFLTLTGACLLLIGFGVFRADEPREGERGRPTVVVIPVTNAPEAEVLSALDRVFGSQLTLRHDKDLQVLILQGPEGAVATAVEAMKDIISKPRFREALRDAEVGPQGIAVVQLRLAQPDTVTKLVKQYVSDTLEITERPTAKALIFEGDRLAVQRAMSLARQLDGQEVHPSLRRFLGAGEREGGREGDRERGERDER